MRHLRFGLVGPALLCSAVALAGCASAPASVEPPRPGASPEEVVAVLIDVVNARDTDALPTVATPDQARTIEQSWFGTAIVEADVDAARPVDHALTGGNESVYVHVDVVLDDTDGSLPEGELVGWGYTLVRQDDGRWLVSEQGVG